MNKTDVLNALALNLHWEKGLDGTRYARLSTLGFKFEVIHEGLDKNSKPASFQAGHRTANNREWTVVARGLGSVEAAKTAVLDWLATQIAGLATVPEDGVDYYGRRWCKGDNGWTNWTVLTEEQYERYRQDASFQVRAVKAGEPAPAND